MFDSVKLDNITFGYYNDSIYNKVISNLSYTFTKGNLYYLESPNGIGKSTLLKSFTHNIENGNIYFDNINRNDLSFNVLHQTIFHMFQSSEFTPTFTKQEIQLLSNHSNRDTYLEERLGLKNLLDKDTIEMSGGQKKRIFLYMVLISNTQIILLDELFSELSTQETHEVPEGGGWLRRVINTLVEWKNLNNKIIILVGHGSLLSKIKNNSNITSQKKNNIVKLILRNYYNKTILQSVK